MTLQLAESSRLLNTSNLELAEAVAATGSLDGTFITERFTATLKGIDKPLRLVRARAHTPDAAGGRREAVA